jgi:LPS sulfotransferase NodH
LTYEFVHILSHMRSGSTLLAHLLASHPEIIGYGETHIRYRSP